MAAEPHYIDVDLKKSTHYKTTTVTQNDTDVVFILRVSDDGRSDESVLDKFSTVTLTSQRRDGQSFYVLGEKIPGTNEVRFALGTKELELTGKVSASAQLYSVDGRQSSAKFNYNVEGDLTGDYVPTETEVTLIEVVLGEGPQRIAEAVAATEEATQERERLAGEVSTALTNVSTAIDETYQSRVGANAAANRANASADGADSAAAIANTSAENADAMATAAEQAAALATTEANDARTQKEEVQEILAAGPVASVNGLTGIVSGLATQESVDQVTAQLADKLSAKQVVTGAQADGQNITFGHETNAIANDVATSVIIGGGTTNNNNIIGGDGTSTIGTPTPNVVSAGTGANVSLVGGYDNVAGSLSSKIISDHSMTEIGGPGHNGIFGGAYGKIKSTTGFGFIAGGQNNELSDGNYSFVTGYNNKVKGQGSAAFGYGHLLNNAANFATGAAHIVIGSFAQAHGSTNKADGNFSKAEGNFSHTRFVSQQSMAGGRFSATGDAQASVMVMHRQTTDATTVNLGVIGSNTSFQLLPNQSVAFTALLVARQHGGTDTAAWEIKGMARRGATGNTVPVGVTITPIGVDAGATAWAVAVAGDSIGGLNVRVTGEAGKIIKWVQRMTLTEVLV